VFYILTCFPILLYFGVKLGIKFCNHLAGWALEVQLVHFLTFMYRIRKKKFKMMRCGLSILNPKFKMLQNSKLWVFDMIPQVEKSHTWHHVIVCNQKSGTLKILHKTTFTLSVGCIWSINEFHVLACVLSLDYLIMQADIWKAAQIHLWNSWSGAFQIKAVQSLENTEDWVIYLMLSSSHTAGEPCVITAWK
jgi:hypothetical protein